MRVTESGRMEHGSSSFSLPNVLFFLVLCWNLTKKQQRKNSCDPGQRDWVKRAWNVMWIGMRKEGNVFGAGVTVQWWFCNASFSVCLDLLSASVISRLSFPPHHSSSTPPDGIGFHNVFHMTVASAAADLTSVIVVSLGLLSLQYLCRAHRKRASARTSRCAFVCVISSRTT